MLPIIETLLVLQDRDRKLLRLLAEVEGIEPQRRHLQSKTERAQSSFEAVRQKGRHLESERKKLELEVETKQEFIRKIETQQGATKSNEQYRAFTHQIATTRGEIQTLEDQELELMEQAETVAREVSAAEKAARELKAETDRQLAEVTAREANLRKELEAVSGARAQLASQIDDGTRSRYERLLKTKGENVIVGVPHGVCGGCHMRLPMQVIVSVKGEQEIVACINCGRLLYFTPDMEA